MKKSFVALTQIKTDLETDLPALVTAASLKTIGIYKLGSSYDAKKVILFVNGESKKNNTDIELFSVFIGIQCYQLQNDGDLIKYGDILEDYFMNYDPANVGCESIEEIEIDWWPVDQNSSGFVYCTIIFKQSKDSCD